MLSVHLLGERRVLDGPDDVSAAIQYRKAWALLGYLAVESGRRHPREHLAQLLWPALSPMAARTNLRQVVANLNRLFDAHGAGGLLLASREDVALQPVAGVAIDLHQLEHAAGPAGNEELLALAEASAGFAGEFLGGLALDDCPGFDEWLQPVRTRLAGAATRALRRLFDAQQAAGLGRQAITTARRLAALEPWDEACQRQLMMALAADGQYDEALAVCERLRMALCADLGTPLSASTVVLRDAIQAARDGGVAFAVGAAMLPASTRHWMGVVACRVHPAASADADALLASAVAELQIAGGRLLSLSGDIAYVGLLAAAEPGEPGAVAVQAARLATALQQALPGRVSIALVPGIALQSSTGAVSALGHPGEWALPLLRHAPAGVTLACEALFGSLFESFALHPHGELVLPEIPRPVRLWRLGAEGVETRAGAPVVPVPGGTIDGPELLTLRIGDAALPIDDGTAIGAWLTVIEGADRGKRAGIGEQPLVVGRASDCDLHLPRRTVSRHHCVVWRDGEHYRIRDLGATNRTRVNAAVVRDARLAEGDRITVGECTLQFGREV